MPSSSIPQKVLLTRPRPSSERWAALLSRHGYICFIEPLLTIKSTGKARPAGQYQAVMITSANAIDALEENRETIADLLDLPCFCVGAVTGQAAHNLGFTDIRSGAGNSADLAQLMLTDLGDRTRPLLHIAGDIVDGKAGEMLAAKGYTLSLWSVYEATAATSLSPTLISALEKGEIAAAPIFSPRSARIFSGLLEKNNLTGACHSITAIALSQAVADVLQSLPWRRLCVARKPNEEEILACLQSEPVMTEPVPALPQKPVPPQKSGNFLWFILFILFLIVGGFYAMQRCPWFQTMAKGSASDNRVVDLEKRVAALETQLATQTPVATAPAPQPNSADLAALNEEVKSLGTRIENQENQNRLAAQKFVATAFTFWELRNMANGGHPFAAQLASLHAASVDDHALSELSAKLDPYATTGAPTWSELHESLVKMEATASSPSPSSETSTLWARVKAIMNSLVSIHTVHPPQFVALEDALAANDAAAAQTAFDALPEQTRKNLNNWQTQLTARIAIDDALRSLAVYFTSPTT